MKRKKDEEKKKKALRRIEPGPLTLMDGIDQEETEAMIIID